MRARLALPLLVVLLASPAVGAEEPKKTQWLPGMPVPAATAAAVAAPQRVVSPEGYFAITVPAGWSLATVLPDPKEIVDRVKVEKAGLALMVERRPQRIGTGPGALEKFFGEEVAAYQADFKGLTFGPPSPAQAAGHPAFVARATGSPKGSPRVVHLAILSDGRSRLDALLQGAPSEATEALFGELLGSLEVLDVAYTALAFQDEIGEFGIVPPAGWLRYKAEGEPPPTRDFRTYSFPARDGSGSTLIVDVVALPDKAGKITADRLIQSLRASEIDQRGAKDTQELARGEAGKDPSRAVHYGVWRFTDAAGAERFMIGGGVAANGRLYWLKCVGAADQLEAHRPLVVEAFGTFTLTQAP